MAEETKEQETQLSKKAQDVLKTVEGMSMLELNELVKAMEEKFGVSAVPAAPAAVPTSTQDAEQQQSELEEKSTYDVVFAAAGDNKIASIKAVREVNSSLGLKEAKDLVEGAPKPVLEGVKKEEAEEAKQKLEAAGAKVELK